MSATVEITHTADQGTLMHIEDEVIKPLMCQPYCWKWSRNEGFFYQQSSRKE